MKDIFGEVFAEIERAEKKFPNFPDDIVHGIAIMAEEAGEAVKASLDAFYGRGTIRQLEKEVIQTIAMGVRFLLKQEEKYERVKK